MKTITAALIFGTVLVFSYSVVSGFAVKQDYQHCLIMGLDAATTDAEITDLVRKCELITGYTEDKELLP